MRICIAYAPQDRDTALRLSELLEARGVAVSCLGIGGTGPAVGVSFDDWVEATIQECDWAVVLWSPGSRESEYLRAQARSANRLRKLFPVRLDGAAPPAEFVNIQALQLDAGAGAREIADHLLRNRRDDFARAIPPAQVPHSHYDQIPTSSGPPSRPPSAPMPMPMPAPRSMPAPASKPQGVFSRVTQSVRDLLQASRRGKGADDSLETATPRGAQSEEPLNVEAPEPVWLGASAPRQSAPGQRFTAALVAYVAAARESARETLEALGEPGDRVLMNVAPQRNATWVQGAPVAVRLTGDGVQASPKEVRFEWNGRENLAAFVVQVHDDAPAVVVLGFEVFVADVPIMCIPMRVNITAHSAPVSVQQTQANVPGSVFASYASKDAQPVTQRLSTLQRWSPALDIFQDCLDLKSNASFQPQIKDQISRREVFLLFWSRNAAASPWVKWEYQTACDTLGVDAILPMPLEDPAIAPPPLELADRHLRDRFMMAGYALAKIRDEASHPPPA